MNIIFRIIYPTSKVISIQDKGFMLNLAYTPLICSLASVLSAELKINHDPWGKEEDPAESIKKSLAKMNATRSANIIGSKQRRAKLIAEIMRCNYLKI